jgi:hypothetical protein
LLGGVAVIVVFAEGVRLVLVELKMVEQRLRLCSRC